MLKITWKKATYFDLGVLVCWYTSATAFNLYMSAFLRDLSPHTRPLTTFLIVARLTLLCVGANAAAHISLQGFFYGIWSTETPPVESSTLNGALPAEVPATDDDTGELHKKLLASDLELADTTGIQNEEVLMRGSESGEKLFRIVAGPLMGGLLMVGMTCSLYSYAFLSAAAVNGVQSFEPLFVAVFELLFFGRTLSWKRMVALIVAVGCSTVLAGFSKSLHSTAPPLLKILPALISATCLAARECLLKYAQVFYGTSSSVLLQGNSYAIAVGALGTLMLWIFPAEDPNFEGTTADVFYRTTDIIFATEFIRVVRMIVITFVFHHCFSFIFLSVTKSQISFALGKIAQRSFVIFGVMLYEILLQPDPRYGEGIVEAVLAIVVVVSLVVYAFSVPAPGTVHIIERWAKEKTVEALTASTIFAGVGVATLLYIIHQPLNSYVVG